MRRKIVHYPKKPAPVDEDQAPVTPPDQAPQPSYLDDKRMRPTNYTIKTGAKSHHWYLRHAAHKKIANNENSPNHNDGDHPFTNRCFHQLHGGWCPDHDELVSYKHGCQVDNYDIKGNDLLAETKNPRAARKDSNKENLPGDQTSNTQDQAGTAKTNRVVKKDMLKEGNSARDVNGKLKYTFGNVHANDPGLGNMSKVQDAQFYAKKAKQNYQRATKLKLGR